MLGEELGNYRIVARLSEGGMGAVYRAEHKLIGKAAAIKVLLPQFSSNREIVERFFNEARATTTIQHPGIVEIFDFGYHTDGRAYIVMEFLQGEPLSQRLRNQGHMDAATAARIVARVASAVGAAHAKNIVHRDLKPDNIFLVPDPDMPSGERAKVLDFGIAKLTATSEGPSLRTRTGAVMGTPVYMAPEQCRGAGQVDHRADVYALGCILYEMLCGRPPFVGEGTGEIIGAHLHVAVTPPRALDPSISPEIEAIVLRALEKDPSCRFQSMFELGQALKTFGAIATTGPVPVVARAGSHPGSAQATTTLGSAAGAAVAAPEGRAGKRGAVIGAMVGGAALAALVTAAVLGLGGPSGDASETDESAAAVPEEDDTAGEEVAETDTPPTSPRSVATGPDTDAAPPTTTPRVPATVSITFDVEPARSRVTVDGKPVTDGAVELPKGDTEHELVVAAKGYKTHSAKLAAKRDRTLAITLEKKPVRRPRRRPARRDPKPDQPKVGPIETDL